ncbi:MAG: signal peptidase I [Prevotella sp.]|nr:signal peptidase I [Prevotellaceae bacterium]MDY3935725.1 signal peptidase I [Prevotella sp.]
MIRKDQKKLNPKVQWAKFIVVTVLYLLFLLWLESWLGLIVLPFIFDAYITKKIKWQWWKETEGPVRFIMSWVDAIVFALVAVYFINLFFFQNYVIPSSSLEKSLLTGDYLFVSKVSYGPRIPQTPLTLPLTQHTLPFFNVKSYIKVPHWEYRRVKGLGEVQLNDIVVFNYPSGDTIMSDIAYQAQDYYRTVYTFGTGLMAQAHPGIDLGKMSVLQQRKFYDQAYALGRDYVVKNAGRFGIIDSRPTDRRENYVKRCVGLPGQTLQIKNKIVYLDGKPNKEPENVQYKYFVKLNGVSVADLLSDNYDALRKELGISDEDLKELGSLHGYDISAGNVLNEQALKYDGYMPLTKHAATELKRRGIAKEITPVTDRDVYAGPCYPLNAFTNWTGDNYGPIWIPAKGKSIDLTLANLPIYERCIKVYEGNDLQVKNDKIYINGKEAKRYTFKLDYYWMMGDNRHNSADSRYWGFVPEDHIVGKPLFVWWSSDPDRRGLSGVRWSRLFKWVDNIK